MAEKNPIKAKKKSSFFLQGIIDSTSDRCNNGERCGWKKSGCGGKRFSIRKTQHEKGDGPPWGKRAKRGETTHERKPTSVHPRQETSFHKSGHLFESYAPVVKKSSYTTEIFKSYILKSFSATADVRQVSMIVCKWDPNSDLWSIDFWQPHDLSHHDIRAPCRFSILLSRNNLLIICIISYGSMSLTA